MKEKSLDRGLLAADQRDDDFTVPGELPGFANGQVVFQNTGVPHGIAPDSQRKEIFSAVNLRIHHHRPFPFLLGVHRQSGANVADNRHFAPSLDPGDIAGAIQNVKVTAVAAFPADIPLAFQRLEELVHGGVADLQVSGGLAKARRLAGFAYLTLQIFEALPLLCRQFHDVHPS